MNSIQPGVLMTVGDLINKNIDFDQSMSRRRPSVKMGVDPHLDELKRRYDGMGSFLAEVVKYISSQLPKWAKKYIRSCIFLPQIGFLTVVESDAETGRGRYEGEGLEGGQWERLFTMDGKVCYKNSFMRELDDEYGDMYCEICGESHRLWASKEALTQTDREVEIIHELVLKILHYEGAIIEASEACGKLDALLALAKGAETYGWVCPRVVEENILDIEAGRHPLQELCVSSFVPNDCLLSRSQEEAQGSGREAHGALVLTGPNHSGKSIYLKQAAIIVYLAHVGSFVPAARATIGLTDKILTRMSTRESMSCPESAFSIDLKQVAQATRSATWRSLVLIDEFGKGTNSEDGAGLLAATLDYFASLGPASPRVMVATHFHELFEGGYLDGYPCLGVAHMEVRTDSAASEVADQITYLFKLRSGHSNSSFGARCAALNGVPSAIVDRAEAIGQLLARNEDLGSACARLSDEEEKRLEEAEAAARLFLQAELEKSEVADGNEGHVRVMLTRLLELASQVPT